MMRASLLNRAGLLAVVAAAAVCVAPALASSAAASSASAASPSASARWSSAAFIPGVPGDWSQPFAVSCTGPGDCTVGGEYGPDDPYSGSLPFVATESGGNWGRTTSLAGIPALAAGLQYAAVTSVSCGWPGNCAAIGYYLPNAARYVGQAFVTDEVNGAWQRARPLGGVTASQNVNELGSNWNLTVSCAPATTGAARTAGLNCLAVGAAFSRGHELGFVARSSHGKWGVGLLVAGLARLDGTRPSQVNAVSCAAPGTCAIGGSYTDGRGHRQAFVATEVGGVWHGAVEVPGTSALNAKGSAEVDAVDCPAPGNCTAAGDYRSKSGAPEFFVARAAWAQWRDAIPVPGVARIGTGAAGLVLSCTPVSCELGGTASITGDGGSRGFLVGQTRGRWSAPHLVPGAGSSVTGLSCPAAGDCAASATVSPALGTNGIVLDEANGVWGKPLTLAPGDDIRGAITAVSCASVGNCAAIGFLPEGSEGGPLAIVATEGK
jgi:hypothetical protein